MISLLISKNQAYLINLIELKTGHKFEGFTFEEADDYISHYIDEIYKPSEKQIKYAEYLSKKYHKKCNAKTRKDYVLYIRSLVDDDYIR